MDNKERKRQGIIVWLYTPKYLNQLSQYGTLHYVSKKMKYALLYVEKKKLDKVKSQLIKLHFVRSIEDCHYQDLTADYSGLLEELDQEAKAKNEEDSGLKLFSQLDYWGGCMRIIAGKYGGRPLKSEVSDETRPTSDQIKESVFNLIGPYFEGGLVLDLYAGTGALGIEAVSRGMDKAYLVDADAKAVKSIQKNITITKEEDKFYPYRSPAAKALMTFKHKQLAFDLIFLDPPYQDEQIIGDIEEMVKQEMVKPGALIVCETKYDSQMPETIRDLTIYKQRKYGTTLITIYERKA